MKHVRWLVLGIVGFIGCGDDKQPGSPLVPGPGPQGTPNPPCPTEPKFLAAGFRPGTTDGVHLYGFADQSIVRMPLGGGTLDTSVRGIDTTIDFGLTVSGNWLYWGASGIGIIRAPLFDGPTFVVADAFDISRFAIAGFEVYYVANASVYRTPAVGSGTPTLVLSDRRVADVTAVGTKLYFTSYSNSGSGVGVYDTLGSGTFQLAAWPGTGADRIAVTPAQTTVFATETEWGLLRAVNPRTGEVSIIFGDVAMRFETEAPLVYDAGHLYTVANHKLWRVPETGGAADVLATDVTTFSIAGDWVYYRSADALYGVCK